VSKAFGGSPAVIDVSLTVPRGSIFGLLGHNGAGKSTMLGMLLGQVFPDHGRLRVAGFDVGEDRCAAMRRVGAIFETPAFYDYLTGWRNLKLLAAYSGPVPRQRFEDVVALVGLNKRIHDRVERYSHGMRQRLALAQALIPEPDVLILDEPNEGLDPEGIREMRDMIRHLNRDHGLTVLLSSHQLGEVASLCSHIAIMREGRVLFNGPWGEDATEQAWIELTVEPRETAIDALREARLIADDRHDDAIKVRPAKGVTSSAIVNHLVSAGWRVESVTPAARSLEDFYLDVVRGQAGASA